MDQIETTQEEFCANNFVATEHDFITLRAVQILCLSSLSDFQAFPLLLLAIAIIAVLAS